VKPRWLLVLALACAPISAVLAAPGDPQQQSKAPPRDAAPQEAAASAAQSCAFVFSGARTTQGTCSMNVVLTPTRGDGGSDETTQIEISRLDAVPAAEFKIMFKAVPSVGRSNLFLALGDVADPPAAWRVIATGSGPHSTTGSSSLNLSSIRHSATDGAQRIELHGTFTATLPEVTGVQGPDLIVTVAF
jgi:hypothetical protein